MPGGAKELRIEFLNKIGMDEKSFNNSIRVMVATEIRRDERKRKKKSRTRRAQKDWKRRKFNNG